MSPTLQVCTGFILGCHQIKKCRRPQRSTTQYSVAQQNQIFFFAPVEHQQPCRKYKKKITSKKSHLPTLSPTARGTPPRPSRKRPSHQYVQYVQIWPTHACLFGRPSKSTRTSLTIRTKQRAIKMAGLKTTQPPWSRRPLTTGHQVDLRRVLTYSVRPRRSL